jgi:hypothetical protein
VLARALHGQAELYGRLEQLGRGGCRIKSPARFAHHEELALEICLGGGVLRATARVVYQRADRDGPWDVGLEFLTVHPPDHPLLELALREAGSPASG